MKKIFTTFGLILFTALLFSFHSQAQSIERRWTIDDLRVVIPEDATDEEREQYEMMESFIAMSIEEMKGTMKVEFKRDGTYIASSPDEGDETGTWSLDGDQLYMTNDVGMDEEPVTIELYDNEMHFVIEEEGVLLHMVFVPY